VGCKFDDYNLKTCIPISDEHVNLGHCFKKEVEKGCILLLMLKIPYEALAASTMHLQKTKLTPLKKRLNVQYDLTT
jgi:hypothetical protein